MSRLHDLRASTENDTPGAVKNGERELEVHAADIGRGERIIEPLVQVAVGEEVETDHGD